MSFYDLIIDVDSFDNLKNKKGWNIEMIEDGQKKHEYFSNIDDGKELEKKELTRIGMLGASGVGKTFILGQLLNKEELLKNKIETKGISLIYPNIGSNKSFVGIDSQGSEEPIIGSKDMTIEDIFKLSDSKKKELIKTSSKDKKFIEIFIQDFIVDKSNVLIVVVDQLKFSEQKLINRLKSHTNFDKLFVIHNLQFFCDIKTIEEHIENVILKSVFSNLEKRTIDYMDDNNQRNQGPFYYYEKEIGTMGQKSNKKGGEILHLFMAKEGSSAGDYFNKETIKYITYLIKSVTKRTFNVIEEVKDFLSLNSIQYMIKEDNNERPILKEDLITEKNKDEDGIFIKCNKDFKLKDCIINEMGISSFSLLNSINPSFICYKGKFKKYKKGTKEIEVDWPAALIIKTEMFVEAEDIKVVPTINDDYDSMILSISCPKKIKKSENIEEIEFLDGDIKEDGEIRIDIKFNLEDIVLDPEIKFIVTKNIPGIKVIYLKIVDDTNKAQNIKKEVIKKNKEKKIKK